MVCFGGGWREELQWGKDFIPSFPGWPFPDRHRERSLRGAAVIAQQAGTRAWPQGGPLPAPGQVPGALRVEVEHGARQELSSKSPQAPVRVWSATAPAFLQYRFSIPLLTVALPYSEAFPPAHSSKMFVGKGRKETTTPEADSVYSERGAEVGAVTHSSGSFVMQEPSPAVMSRRKELLSRLIRPALCDRIFDSSTCPVSHLTGCVEIKRVILEKNPS